MANKLSGNPLVVDTAATIISATKDDPIMVQSLQWVDAVSSAVTAADTLVFTINGIELGFICTIALCEMWSSQLQHRPMRVYELTVSVIDGGALLIWLA